MDVYVKYNAEFRMAVCTICRLGLPSTYVLRHFERQHTATWKAHKDQFRRHIKDWDLISIEDLEQPDGMRELVPGLKVVPGWCCEAEDCTAASGSEKYMRKHAQKMHGWTAPREKIWFACQLQTLLGHPHIKYVASRTMI